MSSRTARIGACFLGAFLFSAAAFAYDDLVTGDTAAMDSRGKVMGSIGLVYFTAGKTFDSDGKSGDLAKDASQFRIPLRVSYGLRDRLTLFAILPYASLDNGLKTTSGAGDIWLGAKFSLLPQNALTLRGALDLAADSDKASGPGNPGGPGADFALMTMRPLGTLEFRAQAGLRLNGEDEDTFAPGTGFYLDAQGAYPLTETVRGVAGVQFKSIGDGTVDGAKMKTGNHALDLTLGGEFRIGGNTVLSGNLLYTLAGKNTPRNFGVIFAIGR
jgi:hypothetical protein